MTEHHESATRSEYVLRATVRGRVQRVGYRAFARDAAERLGLAGYVRNQVDGTVFVEAIGERADLEELVALLKRGPSGAKVAAVEDHWLPASSASERHTEFRVAR